MEDKVKNFVVKNAKWLFLIFIIANLLYNWGDVVSGWNDGLHDFKH